MRRYLGLMLAIVVSLALLVSCAPTPAAPAPSPARPAIPAAPGAPAATPSPAAPAPKAKEIIRMFPGGMGSTSYVWLAAASFLLEKHSTWLKAEVVPTKGFVESITWLAQNKGSVVAAHIYLLNWARAGTNDFAALGKQDMQIIFPLYESAMTAVVLDKSPIKAWTAADLKGKKVAVREIGSSGWIVASSFLQAIGLDPLKDIKALHGGAADGIAAVMDGTADIYATIAGQPYPLLEDMFATKPSRLIPFTKDVVTKANDIAQFGLTLVPLAARTYKGQTAPVPMPFYFGVAATRADVSDDIISEIVRLWWEYADDRNEIHATIATRGTVENLKACEDVGIPYHKAALKYYREKGWFK
ncbi:MAG: TAXI family TRAP transporter solute-binding subunit [Chloroflexota bacterium]